MATRALERGGLERHLVARAEVLATDATGVLARTAAYPDPWPQGPFPPPPDRSRSREGRLRIEAVADTVLRVRYAPGPEVRDGGQGMLTGAPPPATSAEVAAAPDRVVLRTPAKTAVATLDPYRLEVRGATAAPAPSGRVPRAVIGGPDPSYFAVGDSLGTGVGQDLDDGRPVATETFGIGPGDAVYGFGETFLGPDETGQTLHLWVADAMGAHAVDDDVLDYFVLLGSPADVLAGYTALTGRAPVPPARSFGWWQSRCSYGSAEEVLGVVREMRQAGIPMDVVHLSLWQTPYLVEGTRLHDRLARAGGFVRSRDGGLLDIGVHFVRGYQGPVHVVDWANPEAVRVMTEEYGRLLATGAPVAKADFGEELPDEAVCADGTPAERMRNLYPLRDQEAVHAATAAARREGERIAWSRSGWAGAQRFPVHWGGDVPPAWEMMLPQLHGGLSLGLPFVRPLVLEFPDDPATWRIGDQFLCGRSTLAAPLFEPGGRRRAYLPAGTWTDWWTRERVSGPSWVEAEHGLDTMPLWLREGAVVPMGPVVRWVGERPTDPLTVVVAPFEEAGRAELEVPVDGPEVTIRYEARAGRHLVQVEGHVGEVVLDTPASVELRR